MRKGYFRKREYKDGTFPLSCGATFSVKNVTASALINLFDDYGHRPSYFLALTEFVDFEFLREEVTRAVESDPKYKIIKGCVDFDSITNGEEIVRMLRYHLCGNTSRTLLSELGSIAIGNAKEKTHFFRNRISEVSPFDHVARFFSLTEEDTRVLAFLSCRDKIRHFDSLCTEIAGPRERSKILTFIAKALEISPGDVNKALKTLKGKHIIVNGRHALPDLSCEIEDFLFEYDGDDLSKKFSAVMSVEKVFPSSSFDIEKEDISIISKLLNGGNAHILLYGTPGSGKSEFAKAIAYESGKAIFIPSRKGEEKRNALTPMKINATLFAAKNGNGVALIDEADDFLETEKVSFFGMVSCNAEKGAVNTLLDKSRAPVIWITNSIKGIDESTRRRFAYTLEFSGVSEKQKRSVLETTLKENDIPVELSDKIFPIVKRYALSPAGIALAVSNAKVVSEGFGEVFMENVCRIASRHYTLITGKQSTEKVLPVDERFDLSLLNTPPSSETITGFLKKYRSVARVSKKPLPVAMLFSGVSGSGKTQLGRFIARELGKEILIRRMSDIKSPYVGMTEKNIAAAFLEAMREDKVLMIDEADSLFTDRETATLSWETSETNEMLAQMEVFKGVFICTTNLPEKLDSAVMRRFQWKINFRALTLEARIRAFRSYFPELSVSEDELMREMSELEGVCPGDFKVVRERMRYDDAPSAEKVFKGLLQELVYKNHENASRVPIGFSV